MFTYKRSHIKFSPYAPNFVEPTWAKCTGLYFNKSDKEAR